MKNPLLTPELREILASGDSASLAALCDVAHPHQVAEWLEDLEPGERARILALFPSSMRAEVFSFFPVEDQIALVSGQNRREMAALLEQMMPDERADLAERLDPRVREELIPLMNRAAREDLRRLLAQKEGTAGAVMNTDFAAVRPDETVERAIAELRAQAQRKETIYYSYAVDEEGRLIGVVSLRDLMLSPPGQKVSEAMVTDVVSVRADEDQERAAKVIQEYDLLALPVVDEAGRMVGIITHDDVMDIIQREATEDIQRFGAVNPGRAGEEAPYLRTHATTHFRRRVWWVVGLAAAGLISGAIIHRYEHALEAVLILAIYMPMVADTGGNVGSQSATVVIRALALGEIELKQWWRVVLKEAAVGLMLCALLAMLALAKVLFLSAGADLPPGQSLFRIGFAISLALAIQVVASTMIGALLPLLARALRQDPAVVSAPALTTLVDITGLLIYFTTATLLLGV